MIRSPRNKTDFRETGCYTDLLLSNDVFQNKNIDFGETENLDQGNPEREDKMTLFTLCDGSQIPAIGFGTYQLTSDRPVRQAIDAGYRLFDTASLYETERILGTAVRASGVPREEFIIETKLWIDEMDDPAAALDRSLRRLEMDYVDIYMIHWPRETGEMNEAWQERDIRVYHVLEELVAKGKVRKLGLSNFLPHHLENILENCTIHPVVDQLEIHPGYSQEAAVAFCKEKDVLPMAWSPFGRGEIQATAGNAIIMRLAEKYGRSPQQINLRFLIQKGILPIPKASSDAHIRANLEAFSFELSKEDLSLLTCMPQTTWLGEHPDFFIPRARTNPKNI